MSSAIFVTSRQTLVGTEELDIQLKQGADASFSAYKTGWSFANGSIIMTLRLPRSGSAVLASLGTSTGEIVVGNYAGGTQNGFRVDFVGVDTLEEWQFTSGRYDIFHIDGENRTLLLEGSLTQREAITR